MTITDSEARKRLLISRHIAKMTPEEVARRFTVYEMLKAACLTKPRARKPER